MLSKGEAQASNMWGDYRKCVRHKIYDYDSHTTELNGESRSGVCTANVNRLSKKM